VRLRGGRLVAYSEVMSALFISIRSYKVKWIATSNERGKAGVPSSALTAILGWWAFFGPYQSIAALVWNGRGGIDITDALLRADPRSTSLLGYSDAAKFSEFEDSGRRIALRIFWSAVLLLVAALAYLMWSVSRK
jgi:hypothetical protein